MFIENKIKATYNWILAVMFIFSCVINIYVDFRHISVSVFILTASLGLVTYNIYIYSLKRSLMLIEDAFFLLSWIILSTLLVYYSNGIYSTLYPNLYFIVLIYASFVKNKSLYIGANILTAVVLTLWLIVSNIQINWLHIKGYIICLICYIAITVVIKCYSSVCLLCDFNRGGQRHDNIGQKG